MSPRPQDWQRTNAERKVRVCTLRRCLDRHATGQHRLRAVEQILGDQRLEIASPCADAVLRHVDETCIQPVVQQRPNRLRSERTTPAVRQAPGPRLLQHFLFGEAPGRVMLEHGRRLTGHVTAAARHSCCRSRARERRHVKGAVI